MLALLLPANLAYRSGPILSQATPAAQLSIAAGIFVTVLYAAGILVRRTLRMFGVGLDSWLALIVYFASLAALFQIG